MPKPVIVVEDSQGNRVRIKSVEEKAGAFVVTLRARLQPKEAK